MKAPTTLLVVIVVLLACVTSGRGTSGVRVPGEESIKVIVHTSANPIRAVQGARVVILGDDGRELGTSTTDARGTAFVGYRPGVGRPLFVLVEATDCYISGLRWEPALSEYYIRVIGRAAL
jgi:hypothetical protein